MTYTATIDMDNVIKQGTYKELRGRFYGAVNYASDCLHKIQLTSGIVSIRKHFEQAKEEIAQAEAYLLEIELRYEKR